MFFDLGHSFSEWVPLSMCFETRYLGRSSLSDSFKMPVLSTTFFFIAIKFLNDLKIIYNVPISYSSFHSLFIFFLICKIKRPVCFLNKLVITSNPMIFLSPNSNPHSNIENWINSMNSSCQPPSISSSPNWPSAIAKVKNKFSRSYVNEALRSKLANFNQYPAVPEEQTEKDKLHIAWGSLLEYCFVGSKFRTDWGGRTCGKLSPLLLQEFPTINFFEDNFGNVKKLFVGK